MYSEDLRVENKVIPVKSAQREWFERWLLADEGYLPAKFPQSVVLLHPGTVETGNSEKPFAGPPAVDEELSLEQALVLDRVLLSVLNPGTQCTSARYGGFVDKNHGADLIDSGYVRSVGHLIYYLSAGILAECSFSTAKDENCFDGLFPQSFLWPDDHSWFVSSMPDLDFTVIGCDEALAERLVAEPVLSTRHWPDVPIMRTGRPV